ncbi:dihydrofolate reductase family protein [Pseudonocardia sp. TRM90224]|uniref:dihydrofolate reductase family protein n=1 Tax=Pseudonocardia sp. TRM90224 TaxID=2812678 RepID=UPI001E4335F1|nr:dihydrofolate reductase family protein [Pseudonocardia sp. TRM90224]
MTKLIAFMVISADGYHTDEQRSAEWQTFGPEFADLSKDQLDEVDTLVMGRTTFDGIERYWTGPQGAEFDPQIAARMNKLGKIVLSTSATATTWDGLPVPLMSIDELSAWKDNANTAAMVLGSSTAVGALLRAGLVDELRLMISPTILGGGLRVFPTAGRVEMQLVAVRPFESGNVLLTYRPRA